MAALSASSLVCSAIAVFVSTIPPIRPDRSERSSIAAATAPDEAAMRLDAALARGRGSTLDGGGAHALGGLAGGAPRSQHSWRRRVPPPGRRRAGLDEPVLALGALRHVTDRRGDVAHGPPGLLRAGRHLLRRGGAVPAFAETVPITLAGDERIRLLPAIESRALSWIPLAATSAITRGASQDEAEQQELPGVKTSEPRHERGGGWLSGFM